VVLFADIDALRRGKAGVDDAVAVVVARAVVERGLERARRLVEGAVADGVHLDLEAEAVRRLAERRHLLVGVVQHAGIRRVARVGRVHGGVLRAEAAVERAGKAAADARKSARGRDPCVHRLRKHADLHPALRAPGKPRLHGDVGVEGETHAADAVDHADAARRLVVRRALHIPQQLADGDGVCDVVRHGEKRLLIHLARVGVVAAQRLDLLRQLLQKRRVHHAGVPVVLDEEQRLAVGDAVQLLAADKAALRDRVRRRPEGDERLAGGAARKLVHHLQDLVVRRGVHDVQPRVEERKGREVLVRVGKRGDQRPLAEADALLPCVRRRKLSADVGDPAAVLDQIAADLVGPVDGQNAALVDLHVPLPFSPYGFETIIPPRFRAVNLQKAVRGKNGRLFFRAGCVILSMTIPRVLRK